MTERKRWPNEAEWAREEAIAQARRGLKAGRAIARIAREPETVKHAADLIDTLHQIIQQLMAVGPGGAGNKTAGMLAA